MSDKAVGKNFISYPYSFNEENVDDLLEYSENKGQIFDSLDGVENEIIQDISDLSKTAKDRKYDLGRLHDIYESKYNLLKTMDDDLTYVQDRYISTAQSNKGQAANLDIVNQELQSLKKKNERFQENNTNKIRQIQINAYYQKKYAAQINVLKIISIIAILIIILSMLKNKGILPKSIFGIIVGLVLVCGIILILYQLVDILMRDKNNFDEYDHSIYASSSPSSDSNKPFIEFAGEDEGNGCPSSV